MNDRISLAFLLLLGLVLAACLGEAEVDLDADTQQALDRVESEVDQLRDEIDASELQADLESAWEAVEEELTQTVQSIRSGEAVDTEEIERQLDEFQQTLESVDAQESLEEAWSELRTNLEEVMAAFG
jgi:septal ring factor EnvC (AmiA/AmiB activator)